MGRSAQKATPALSRQRDIMNETTDSIATFVTQLAAELGETDPDVHRRLARIVKGKGAAFALAVLDETRQVERGEGLLVADGTRRRTLGGVWFFLAKARMTTAERYQLAPYDGPRPDKTGGKSANVADLPPTWAELGPLVDEALNARGEIRTVKITVIGRPNKIVERPGFALLTLQDTGKLPALPKGVPTPAQPLPTTFIVYIGGKQWAKVAAALKNAEDQVIVEGVPALDPRYNAITVFCTSATTKALQRAQREQQPAPPTGA